MSKEKNIQVKERLLKEIILFNNCLRLKIYEEKDLKEILSLLNRKIKETDIAVPCLFTYKDGEIKLESYHNEEYTLSYLKLFKEYNKFKEELYRDENTLLYDASTEDIIILSKTKEIDYVEYTKKCLNIGISHNDIFNALSNISYLAKEAILYLMDNYQLKRKENGITTIILHCIHNKNIEFLRKIIENENFKDIDNLNYALGISYGINSDTITEYLIDTFKLSFTKEIYKTALHYSIIYKNYEKVKKISKRINTKNEDTFHLSLWVGDRKIIDFLLNNGFPINQNKERTIDILVSSNNIDLLIFLKDRGLKLYLESNYTTKLINKAYRKGKMNMALWVEQNIIKI